MFWVCAVTIVDRSAVLLIMIDDVLLLRSPCLKTDNVDGVSLLFRPTDFVSMNSLNLLGMILIGVRIGASLFDSGTSC